MKAGLFLILFPVLFFTQGCRKDSPESQSGDYQFGNFQKDSMEDCNDYRIYNDTFFHFAPADTQFIYYGAEEDVRMVRNGKDTIVFKAGQKQYGTFSHKLVPCRYYFAYYDQAMLSFTNKDSIEFSIKWEIFPQYQSSMMGSVYHNFGIRFNGLDFYNRIIVPEKDGLYMLESKSLKSYVIYVKNGKIVKMVLRGGETWEVLP